MDKIKITQVKSGIDRSERQKLTLKALGLNKLHAVKEVAATPQILGMVRKVNHLVTVENLGAIAEPVDEVVAILEEPTKAEEPVKAARAELVVVAEEPLTVEGPIPVNEKEEVEPVVAEVAVPVSEETAELPGAPVEPVVSGEAHIASEEGAA